MKKILKDILFVVCVIAAAAVVFAAVYFLPLTVKKKMIVSGAIIVLGIVLAFVDAAKRKKELPDDTEEGFSQEIPSESEPETENGETEKSDRADQKEE